MQGEVKKQLFLDGYESSEMILVEETDRNGKSIILLCPIWMKQRRPAEETTKEQFKYSQKPKNPNLTL